MLIDWLRAVWDILRESSIWLLLGFLVAGLLHGFLPAASIKNLLSRRGFGSILKASAIGVPLPLCSCSVIPVGVSLRKAGASKGATASFFVSTPEIGVDSFLLSYGLLGPFIAVARAIAAFLSAVTVGLLIDRYADNDDPPLPPALSAQSCCHSQPEETADASLVQPQSLAHRLRSALRFGFVDLVDDIAILLFIGICLSAVITVFVPADALSFSGAGRLLSMFAMLVVSLPLYVCASSSTPIAAALVAKGLDPGAAIVFLLAGPASNVSTMLVIRREMGGRGLFFYLAGIATVSLLFGFSFSYFASTFGFTTVAGAWHDHHSGLFSTGAAIALGALMLRSIALDIAKRFGPTATAECH